MERWFKTLKGECIRVKTPLSLDDARRLVAEFVGPLGSDRVLGPWGQTELLVIAAGVPWSGSFEDYRIIPSFLLTD